MAGVTAVFAIAAERAVTGIAAVAVFGRDAVTAGCAVDTVPFIERAVGRARVVGSQDLPHENEEFADQATGQGVGNGLFSVAFAQRQTAHVRVRMACGALIRIESSHRVRGTLCEAVEVEPDLERAEVEFFKNDPLGSHCNQSLAESDGDILELVLQRGDLSVELRDRWHGSLGLSQNLQLVRQRENRELQALLQSESTLSDCGGHLVLPGPFPERKPLAHRLQRW